jgi:hypothetical protein
MRYALSVFLITAFSLLSFHSPLSIAVQGKVTDQKGIAMAGISIIEKGTSTATTTDVNGDFKIVVRSEKSVLVFSGVGYDSQQVF